MDRLLALACFLSLAGPSALAAPAPGCPSRPDSTLEEDQNFGIVRPGRILRSRKPSKAFLRYLIKEYGLTAIVDLRNPSYKDEGKDMAAERKLAESLSLRWVASTVEGLVPLPQRDAVLRTAEAGPVLVHCHGGKDRTGGVVALTRLLEGWSYAEAALEMRAYGHEPEKDRELHAALKKTFAEADAPLESVRPGFSERLRLPWRCR